jgi:hypothetical protein
MIVESVTCAVQLEISLHFGVAPLTQSQILVDVVALLANTSNSTAKSTRSITPLIDTLNARQREASLK